ncbi:hypothetical protein GBAR_LOCUS26771, partial [Geodia barretti]
RFSTTRLTASDSDCRTVCDRSNVAYPLHLALTNRTFHGLYGVRILKYYHSAHERRNDDGRVD